MFGPLLGFALLLLALPFATKENGAPLERKTAETVAVATPPQQSEPKPEAPAAEPPSDPLQHAAPRMGEEARLVLTSMAGTTEKDLNDILGALSHNDKIGFEEIVTEGRACQLTKDTKVLPIGLGGFPFAVIKVRVLEGPHFGEVAWLPIEFVKPIKDSPAED